MMVDSYLHDAQVLCPKNFDDAILRVLSSFLGFYDTITYHLKVISREALSFSQVLGRSL